MQLDIVDFLILNITVNTQHEGPVVVRYLGSGRKGGKMSLEKVSYVHF